MEVVVQQLIRIQIQTQNQPSHEDKTHSLLNRAVEESCLEHSVPYCPYTGSSTMLRKARREGVTLSQRR